MKNSTLDRFRLRTTLAAGTIAVLGLSGSALACDPADFNMSGHVGLEDLSAYLTAFLSGDRFADFNADSRVTVQDLFDFIGQWVPRYIEEGQNLPTEPIAEPTDKHIDPTLRPTDDRSI